MLIYNSKKIYYYTTFFIVTILTLNYTNSNYEYKQIEKSISSGNPIASSDIKPTPLINFNINPKIQENIFTNLNKSENTISKNNDYLNKYLINIFCSETSNKYMKVASGSGVFLSNPNETNGIILTNAHVARHLLDANKKCVGRTGSPTKTTHTLVLRYIPYHWLDKHNKYVIGDPDQSSTGEYDFAILESKSIKPITSNSSNIYKALSSEPKIKISNYADKSYLDNIYVYSYPAQSILSKNVNNPLYLKKDIVSISAVYANPGDNINDSLLDVTGSKYIDHGSSGGMVVSQGLSNSIIGLSSILIKNNNPQVVRVVTIKHVLSTIEKDLEKINNAQTDPFLYLIKDLLKKNEADISTVGILKNIKLTSVLEKYTKETLVNLNIIK